MKKADNIEDALVNATAYHLGTEAYDRDMREYGLIPISGAATKIVRLLLARVAQDCPDVAVWIREDPPSEATKRLVRGLVDEAATELAKMHINIGLGALGQIASAQEPPPPVVQGPSTPQ